jgi:hypothetical protein
MENKAKKIMEGENVADMKDEKCVTYSWLS